MLTIWFIRHAQSQANAGEITCDPAAIALTPLGREQAIHVASIFEHAPDLVISSPYLRAQQTAKPLLDRFPDARAEIWPVQEFTYLCPDRCRNTTVHERLPLAEEYWKRKEPHYIDGGGAESFAALMGRVDMMWQKLSAYKCSKEVVIFTHAQFVRAAIWYWLYVGEQISDRGMRRFQNFLYSFSVPNGAIVKTRLDPAFWVGTVSISHIPAPLQTS